VDIKDIQEMRRNNYKKVMLEFDGIIDISHFNLPGVTRLTLENNVMEFLYKGDINKIIQRLQGVKLANMLIEEPTLEEIFMHYYQKEE
jgi:ABC-2 type transport system ATP-binding protein